MRSQLLWLSLAPCGRRYSLDALWQPRTRDDAPTRTAMVMTDAQPGSADPSKRVAEDLNAVPVLASAGFYLQQAALYWAALMFRRPGVMVGMAVLH